MVYSVGGQTVTYDQYAGQQQQAQQRQQFWPSP
jgi:hypothetical protein